jgi:hypothetical protein
MDSIFGLARRFRELAGFTEDEIEEIAEISNTALLEAKERRARLRQEAAAALGYQ